MKHWVIIAAELVGPFSVSLVALLAAAAVSRRRFGRNRNRNRRKARYDVKQSLRDLRVIHITTLALSFPYNFITVSNL